MAPIEELEYECIDRTDPLLQNLLNPTPTFTVPPVRIFVATVPEAFNVTELFQNVQVPRLPNLRDILIDVPGSENLSECSRIKLKVIANEISLQHLSLYMPNLKELTLDGSVLGSLRNLGCGLVSLKILKVNRCGLKSFDGVYGVHTIEELHASNNLISNICQLTTLENIVYINIKSNKICDVNSLTFLKMCDRLQHLELDDNAEISEPFNYRETVKKFIPSLKSLDGIPYSEEETARILRDVPKHNSEENRLSMKKEQGDITLPPIKDKTTSKPSTSYSSDNKDNSRSSNSSSPHKTAYSVSFSPRVLSTSGTSNETKSTRKDTKVRKTELPKI